MATGNFLRALGVAVALSGPVAAQDLFSPVIVVNDRAVTGYELDQRVRLLDAFGTPGDLPELARTQLVEERLKQQELDRVGIALEEDGLERALEDFASRANLSAEAFVAQLEGEGIAYESLRDYVGINASWRDYIRARYAERIEISDEELEQALAQQSNQTTGIEVLLSEIVIPAPEGQEAQARAVAEEISGLDSAEAFSAAAREVSAVPSRDQGGQLDWVPLSNYPEALRDLLLGLAPGEVTPPLPVTGAVALLQLRAVREGQVPAAAPESVDYALVRIPGGRSPEALAQAAQLDGQVDDCVDLFGKGLPDGNIQRETVAPAAIPQDVALDLAALDAGEATWGRTENGGQVLVFTMLCGRTFGLPEGAPDRDAVRNLLRGEQLQGYADTLIADLRASATIVGE
ncbi:peptidylprolyl isomerase [Rubellimicrobium rubrum]|uniref:Parvulin-like PPIase n=1 Tax=Rubellimicrobium rubrum TaxID=2585369 RepID=A0A5C4N468_9RHOB|nr:peptidylprolyl isomerase [Rubellimicrobium rubrum]TNC52765.1 peptidylprolyl isomerase [Rubellimicrobium rubrum]